METDVLIKWLAGIDHKLKNRSYVKERSFTSKVTGEEIKMPPVTVEKYNSDEIMDMHTQKTEIIMELHRRAIISTGGLVKYYLTEDPLFTPGLIINSKTVKDEKHKSNS